MVHDVGHDPTEHGLDSILPSASTLPPGNGFPTFYPRLLEVRSVAAFTLSQNTCVYPLRLVQ